MDAQNALCLFADAHWLEQTGHAHYYVCGYPLEELILRPEVLRRTLPQI